MGKSPENNEYEGGGGDDVLALKVQYQSRRGRDLLRQQRHDDDDRVSSNSINRQCHNFILCIYESGAKMPARVVSQSQLATNAMPAGARRPS